MLIFPLVFLFPFFLTYIDSLFSVVWRTAPKGATEPLGLQNNESLQNRWGGLGKNPSRPIYIWQIL